MLTIRAAQMAKLGEWRRKQRLMQWREELRGQFPDETASMSDSELLAAMNSSAARAAEYGIESAEDVYRFLSLGLCLGWSFDADQSWVRAMLTDPQVLSPSHRLRNVYGECIRRLEMDERNRQLRREFDGAEAQ
jgi:hypothetical protein